MLNYRTLLSSVLMFCLISPCALAKGNLNDWNNVRILDSGETITVKTKLGEKYEGRFDHATAERLFVVVNVPHVMQRIIELHKDEVKEVRKQLSRVTSLVICTGAGLGTGLALGAAIDAQDKYGEDPGLGKAVLGAIGLAIGAAIGARANFNGKRVYETP